jgi:hypothetical protein
MVRPIERQNDVWSSVSFSGEAIAIATGHAIREFLMICIIQTFTNNKRNTEWFSVQDCVIHARGCRETFGKRKNTWAADECIFTLSESRATSMQVHGSRYPAWKTVW